MTELGPKDRPPAEGGEDAVAEGDPPTGDEPLAADDELGDDPETTGPGN